LKPSFFQPAPDRLYEATTTPGQPTENLNLENGSSVKTEPPAFVFCCMKVPKLAIVIYVSALIV
jgi:hypothetical protein